MSSNYQQITVVGNLGRDPESRTTQNGKSMTTFSVATKPAMGDDTLWIDVAMFGKLGDIAAQYLKKGAKVLLVGRFQAPRVWTKQDGITVASLSMVANEMTMLGSANAAGGANGNGAYAQNGNGTNSRRTPTGPLEPVMEEGDDIPF